jgi:hypothetical protein
MLPVSSPEFMTQAVEIVFTMGAAIVAVFAALFTGRF